MTALSTDGSEEKNVNFSSINKARCFVESFYIKMRYYYFPGIFFSGNNLCSKLSRMLILHSLLFSVITQDKGPVFRG